MAEGAGGAGSVEGVGGVKAPPSRPLVSGRPLVAPSGKRKKKSRGVRLSKAAREARREAEARGAAEAAGAAEVAEAADVAEAVQMLWRRLEKNFARTALRAGTAGSRVARARRDGRASSEVRSHGVRQSRRLLHCCCCPSRASLDTSRVLHTGGANKADQPHAT